MFGQINLKVNRACVYKILQVLEYYFLKSRSVGTGSNHKDLYRDKTESLKPLLKTLSLQNIFKNILFVL